MNNTIKIIVLVIVLIAILLSATNVKAYDPDTRFSKVHTVTGHKPNTVMVHEWHKPKHKEHNTVLMQDLTQCKLTNNGQIVCVDVCGGLSTPYTVCSYE